MLLDWEKAFDKLTREGLMNSLRRANLPDKMVKIIDSIYRNPEFMVEIDGEESRWHQQETGIRQGCPLSPYLFVIYMTVMFADIKDKISPNRARHRVQGARFDEILFADDTICISHNPA